MSAEEVQAVFSSADENVKLKARIRELESRLTIDDTYIEIERGKVVFVRGNDRRGNPPELPAGEASKKTG